MKQTEEIDFNKEVGERIRKRRLELGLRQEDLAVAMNRNLNAVSGIENGKYILSFPQAVVLSAALNCSLEWIAGAKKKSEQPEDPFNSLPLMQRRVMNELNALPWKDQREVLRFVRYMAYRRTEKGGIEYADETDKGTDE